MARHVNPTGLNCVAAPEIQRRVRKEIVALVTEALRPMHALSTRGTVTPAQAVRALRTLRASRHRLDQLIFDLAGAAVLGGVPVGTIVDRTGMPASTLTRRLPSTPAALRGREIIQSPASTWGWREL